MGLYKATNDISICQNLEDENKKEKCIFYVSKINRNISICLMVQNQTYKDDCASWIGYFYNDSSICEIPVNETKQDSCFIEQYVRTNNTELLYKINNPKTRDYMQTLFLDNMTLELIEQNYSAPCYYIWTGFNSIAFCSLDVCNHLNQPYNDDCIKFFAIKYRDEKVCSKINDTIIKNNCIEIINSIK